MTLTWMCSQLRLPRPAAILLAEVAALVTLQTAPDLGQSLYWQTGMLTYLLPLILASALLGWIARAVASRRLVVWQVALSGLVTFAAGGLSETYLIPQNVALSLAILVCAVWGQSPARRVALPHLVAALGGGVLALVTIVVAPATTYRLGGGTPADLWLASSAAIATAAYQVLRLARYFPLSILVCLLAPGAALSIVPAAGRAPVAISGRWFTLLSALVAIGLPFCYFPSFYAQNGNPPARSLIVPGAILTAYLLFVGYALWGWLRRPLVAPGLGRPLRTASLLLLVLVPVAVAATTVPEIAAAARYASLWDTTDGQIRASRDAGVSDVVIAPLPPFLGESFVTPDRNNWFNVCVARYYGVQTIAAQPGG
jgi:hypothetical protein